MTAVSCFRHVARPAGFPYQCAGSSTWQKNGMVGTTRVKREQWKSTATEVTARCFDSPVSDNHEAGTTNSKVDDEKAHKNSLTRDRQRAGIWRCQGCETNCAAAQLRHRREHGRKALPCRYTLEGKRSATWRGAANGRAITVQVPQHESGRAILGIQARWQRRRGCGAAHRWPTALGHLDKHRPHMAVHKPMVLGGNFRPSCPAKLISSFPTAALSTQSTLESEIVIVSRNHLPLDSLGLIEPAERVTVIGSTQADTSVPQNGCACLQITTHCAIIWGLRA